MTALDASLLSRDVGGRDRASRARVLRWVGDNRAAALITALSLACYLVISLTAYMQYDSSGFDLGIFDQAVRSYAHFHAPISSVKAPGFNILGDHFSPIIALFAPLYWIWDNPCMLLIAQALLVAASVPIVYRIADRRLPRWSAIFVTAIYAFGWPMEAMVNFDVHEVAFAVPLLAAALDAAERRRERQVLAWSLPLLLIKEDMGFLLIALAVVLTLQARRVGERDPLSPGFRRHLRAAGAMVLVGVAGYLVTTKVFIPAFAPNGQYTYWQYGAVGRDLPDALTNLVTRPLHALGLWLWPGRKILTLAMLLLPLGLIPLRSPYALLCAPLLAERFFNDRKQLWVPIFHYNALVWLALTVALVDAAGRRGLFAQSASARRRLLLGSMVLAGLMAMWMTSWIQEAGLKSGFLQRVVQWDNAAVVDREAAIALVPADVCVEADNYLVPHLTPRDYVTLPGAPGIRPDFVLIDTADDTVGPSQSGVPGAEGPKSGLELERALNSGFRVIARFRTVFVLRSADFAGPTRQCRPTGTGRSDPSW